MNALDRAVARLDTVQLAHRPFAVAVGVVKKYGEDNGRRLSAAIAFYGFFSLFPLMLVLVSALDIALRNDTALRERILKTTLAQFPVIGGDIQRNIGSSGGSFIAVAAGLLGALWAGTGAFTTLQQAFDQVWGVPRRKRSNQFGQRLRALAGVALVGVGLVGLTLVSSVLAGIRGSFGLAGLIGLAAATAVLMAALFAGVFRVLTRADVSWRDVLPGAVLAGAGWVALGAVGGYYVTRVVQGASDTYGVFAVVIGLLSWLLLVAQLVLYAAELNVVLARRLWPRSLRDEHAEEPPARWPDRTE